MSFQSIGSVAQRVVDKIEPEAEYTTIAGAAPLEPGVYLGLPEDIYHNDNALGSTDIRRLRRSAADFWWTSSLNPNRPVDSPTPSQAFGRAIHLRVLEGHEKFCRRYECAPDPAGLLRTDADIAEWLTARGVNKLPRLKGEKVRQALSIDPNVRILDEIERKAEAGGRELIKREDWDRIVTASDVIKKNPDLATAFTGGMPEVSVIWTRDDDVRCKARFDFLKPRGIADLKSIRNSLGLDFVDACRRSIANYRYDIQAAHYLEGRLQLSRLVDQGLVFQNGTQCTDVAEGALKQVAASDEFGFVFVFFQADDAPISWACALSPGNPVLEIGREAIEAAITRYKEFSSEFSPGEMWTLAEPVEELNIDDLPGYFGR